MSCAHGCLFIDIQAPGVSGFLWLAVLEGEAFFYMAFACCVNVYMVSVHTGST